MIKRSAFLLLLLGLTDISGAPRSQRCVAKRCISSGHARVAIVGVGSVGATTAYAIMMRNIASEILLVDRNGERCQGELFDMSDALPVSSTARVCSATIKDAAMSDIIIITAGARRHQGQTRLELVRANQKVVAELINQMVPLNPKAILIVVTNPVDSMTLWAQKLAGLPLNQVFGTGTYLDTQRLRGFIAEKLSISQQSIDAYILGEHGDSQCAIWSSAQIAGVPLRTFQGITRDDLDEFARAAKQKGADIIKLKGSTYYGIAACIADLCESIIFNQKRIFPLSVYSQEYEVCLSMPAVLGENGIEQVLQVPLDALESEKLAASVKKLSSVIAECIAAPAT